MNTREKHDIWELDVAGFEMPVLASSLMRFMSSATGNSKVSQSLLKSYIGNSHIRGEVFVKCSECSCPLQLIAENSTTPSFFRHDAHKAPNSEDMQNCQFYSANSSFFGPGDKYKGEGRWHFEQKHWIGDLLNRSPSYQNVSVEKFIFSKSPDIDERRKPDISFEDQNGNRFAIELTRWWMSPDVVAKRERFFRDQGINLLWLFTPDCEEHNATTFNLILFGSPSSRSGADFDVLTKVECNAFVLTKEATTKSNEENDLFFEVRFPIARFNEISESIDFEISRELHCLSDAILNPTECLPFIINTSTSFLAASEQKNFYERQGLLKFIRTVRQIAYREVSYNNLDELKLAGGELNTFDGIPPEYRHYESLRKLYERARRNLSLMHTDYLSRLARHNAAREVNRIRKNINRIRMRVKLSITPSDIDVTKAQLGSLISLSAQFHSPVVLARFKSLQKMIDSKISSNESPKAAVIESSMAYEMFSYIRELESAFMGHLPDLDSQKIKANRIAGWARRNGYRKEAELIPRLLASAIKQVEEFYCKQTYPNLSKGWESGLLYRDDLDKAIRTMKMERLGPKRNQQRSPEQAATIRLLQRFCESLETILTEGSDAIVYSEPATLSAFLAKTHQQLHQLVLLVFYIQKNLTQVKIEPLVADIVWCAIKLYKEGLGINQIQRQCRSVAGISGVKY